MRPNLARLDRRRTPEPFVRRFSHRRRAESLEVVRVTSERRDRVGSRMCGQRPWAALVKKPRSVKVGPPPDATVYMFTFIFYECTVSHKRLRAKVDYSDRVYVNVCAGSSMTMRCVRFAAHCRGARCAFSRREFPTGCQRPHSTLRVRRRRARRR
jgi:hypothetical protein